MLSAWASAVIDMPMFISLLIDCGEFFKKSANRRSDVPPVTQSILEFKNVTLLDQNFTKLVLNAPSIASSSSKAFFVIKNISLFPSPQA